jgi:hypothetical protein
VTIFRVVDFVRINVFGYEPFSLIPQCLQRKNGQFQNNDFFSWELSRQDVSKKSKRLSLFFSYKKYQLKNNFTVPPRKLQRGPCNMQMPAPAQATPESTDAKLF